MAKGIKITIFGHLKTVEFHTVKGAAQVSNWIWIKYKSFANLWQECENILQQLQQKDPKIFDEPLAVGLLECDWVIFKKTKKKVGL